MTHKYVVRSTVERAQSIEHGAATLASLQQREGSLTVSISAECAVYQVSNIAA
jgi:hypothetical protein